MVTEEGREINADARMYAIGRDPEGAEAPTVVPLTARRSR